MDGGIRRIQQWTSRIAATGRLGDGGLHTDHTSLVDSIAPGRFAIRITDGLIIGPANRLERVRSLAGFGFAKAKDHHRRVGDGRIGIRIERHKRHVVDVAAQQQDGNIILKRHGGGIVMGMADTGQYGNFRPRPPVRRATDQDGRRRTLHQTVGRREDPMGGNEGGTTALVAKMDKKGKFSVDGIGSSVDGLIGFLECSTKGWSWRGRCCCVYDGVQHCQGKKTCCNVPDYLHSCCQWMWHLEISRTMEE